MLILRRIGAVLAAVGLLAGVVYLGIRSGRDTNFVVWFGIASAIAAPVGLSLIGYALASRNKDLIDRLAKVPEITRLIEEAKSHEEKIQLLEQERARLADVIRLESRRQATLDRIESLERDAVRILAELEVLDEELRAVDVMVGDSAASKEIQALRKRVSRHDWSTISIRFGGRTYSLDRDLIKAIPIGGGALVAYLRLIERLQRHGRVF